MAAQTLRFEVLSQPGAEYRPSRQRHTTHAPSERTPWMFVLRPRATSLG